MKEKLANSYLVWRYKVSKATSSTMRLFMNHVITAYPLVISNLCPNLLNVVIFVVVVIAIHSG